jgi:hypothetical protein
MKTISLTQGKVALVDDQDFDWINQWKWHAQKRTYKCGKIIWYAKRSERYGQRCNGQQRAVYMHREIASRAGFPKVDHKNSDGLDNRRRNLRPCNNSQNTANQIKNRGSSTFKGVTWVSKRSKWQAGIKINGESLFLGYFNDEVEAAKAYDAAATHYFGPFSKINFS